MTNEAGRAKRAGRLSEKQQLIVAGNAAGRAAGGSIPFVWRTDRMKQRASIRRQFAIADHF
jgi:hypothetical protein